MNKTPKLIVGAALAAMVLISALFLVGRQRATTEPLAREGDDRESQLSALPQAPQENSYRSSRSPRRSRGTRWAALLEVPFSGKMEGLVSDIELIEVGIRGTMSFRTEQESIYELAEAVRRRWDIPFEHRNPRHWFEESAGQLEFVDGTVFDARTIWLKITSTDEILRLPEAVVDEVLGFVPSLKDYRLSTFLSPSDGRVRLSWEPFDA